MRHANFVLVSTQDGITDLKAIGRTVQLGRRARGLGTQVVVEFKPMEV